jgi:UDP-4-amino-4,6-dideoxy-N-acetyl-beta-L-altrosamine transaminase
VISDFYAPSIPYARQSISEADIEQIVRVLRSPFLTQGPEIELFEAEIALRLNAAEAIAVCNATSALHLVCQALDVGPGDLVWTSPISFVASANCARYCGADVDFVDIEPGTRNISVAAFEAKLVEAKRQGRLPKLLIAVHFGGLPCDLAPIAQLARSYGVRVAEDASHALGARYGDSIIGDSRYSDATILSFHPVKIITTGEGGMVLTNDSAIASRVRLLRSHGITRDPARLSSPDVGAWYYEQIALGENYRITDLAAALGRSQLTRLDQFIARRETLAERYDRAFAMNPEIGRPAIPANRKSAWHLYPIDVPRYARRAIFDRLRSVGILANVHYIPIHLQPYYRSLGFAEGDFPQAERYYGGAISLPMYADLTESEQAFVVEHVQSAVAAHRI